ncbi:hypothetical protein SCLCIDRAFT_335773 [Scleroderma citrinum Foug A]|uniref:Uncharacterized protein n=1 Tax=Scleroderma citrinum Foug A TaxID=1036808 RepID=A0A0C3DF08_9AGAM|nr:hypothetical protein SCLCIDRAFT_335773 [Scleroderma citrinum Foug A]
MNIDQRSVKSSRHSSLSCPRQNTIHFSQNAAANTQKSMPYNLRFTGSSTVYFPFGRGQEPTPISKANAWRKHTSDSLIAGTVPQDPSHYGEIAASPH